MTICNNLLIVSGLSERVRCFISNSHGIPAGAESEIRTKRKLSLIHVCPPPALWGSSGSSEDDPSWRLEHWGTSEDIIDSDTYAYGMEDNGTLEASIAFTTRWSPPKAWVSEAARIYGVSLTLKYKNISLGLSGTCYVVGSVLVSDTENKEQKCEVKP